MRVMLVTRLGEYVVGCGRHPVAVEMREFRVGGGK